MKNFSSKGHLKKHMDICKMVNDEMRQLEMDTNTKYTHNPTYCRFCKMTVSKPCHLSRHLGGCPSKEMYKMELMAKAKQSVITNTTINGNVNNNTMNVTNTTYVVNSLGSENISYVTCEVIKNLLKDCSSNEEFMAKTLAYIHAHEEHPENHNIVYSNLRSNTALVK
jgi:hypothetical protein